MSFGASILSIICAVYIIDKKERDNDHLIKDDLLNVHKLFYACQFCANQTLGLVSDSFLLYFLLAAWESRHLAWVVIASYILQLLGSMVVLFRVLILGFELSRTTKEEEEEENKNRRKIKSENNDDNNDNDKDNDNIRNKTKTKCTFSAISYAAI